MDLILALTLKQRPLVKSIEVGSGGMIDELSHLTEAINAARLFGKSQLLVKHGSMIEGRTREEALERIIKVVRGMKEPHETITTTSEIIDKYHSRFDIYIAS